MPCVGSYFGSLLKLQVAPCHHLLSVRLEVGEHLIRREQDSFFESSTQEILSYNYDVMANGDGRCAGILAPDRSTSLEGGGKSLKTARLQAWLCAYVDYYRVSFSPLDLFFFFFRLASLVLRKKSCWHLGLSNSEIGSVNDIG